MSTTNQSTRKRDGNKLKQAINNNPDELIQQQTLTHIEEYLKLKGQRFSYEFSMRSLHVLLSNGSRYNNAGDYAIFIELLLDFFFLPENSSRFKWPTDTVLEYLIHLKQFFEELDGEEETAEYDYFLFSERFRRVKEAELKSGLSIQAEISFYKKKIKALKYQQLLERAYPIP